MKKITKENITDIDFDKGEGLVPAILQDVDTNEVLMLGYMNAGSLLKTLNEGKVTFYSRSKERFWTKGETSGHFLLFQEAYMDCDADAILVFARPVGPVCHTGNRTCFDLPARTDPTHADADFNAPVTPIAADEIGGGDTFSTGKFDLKVLEEIVLDRKNHPKEGSYTNHLFNSGINKVAQKVGEEAVELVIEAKDDNDDLFRGEAADLLYHFLVLLSAKNIRLEEVYKVLKNRHEIRG